MYTLIKKSIAIVLAIYSLFLIADTTVTVIKVLEAMRLSGEISNALALILGGLSGVAIVLVGGAVLAILVIAINKMNNNKRLTKCQN